MSRAGDLMFGSGQSVWHEYGTRILDFCDLLNWKPSPAGREILLQIQRGYSRIGVAGISRIEALPALGAACIWYVCCWPNHLQLIIGATTKGGQSWVQFLAGMSAHSQRLVRENLLFSEGNHSVYLRGSDEPSISVLSPALISGLSSRLVSGRRAIVVMPDFDRIPTRWLGSIRAMVSEKNDQWITCSAARE